MTWHVYLLRCSDDTFYTGITTDLDRRLAEHNAGAAGAKYTRARRPVTLAWSEPATDRTDAARREYRVRKLPRTEKERLAAAAQTSSTIA
jgi:putative endonuclease